MKLGKLYQSKETKLKKYIKTKLNRCKHKMDTLFMNSENSRTSKSYVQILNLTDKIDLKKVKKVLFYQTLTFTIDVKM